MISSSRLYGLLCCFQWKENTKDGGKSRELWEWLISSKPHSRIAAFWTTDSWVGVFSWWNKTPPLSASQAFCLVCKDSRACLSLARRSGCNTQPVLGSFQENWLDLLQIMTNSPAIWPDWGAFDDVSQTVAQTVRKPSTYLLHCAECSPSLQY